MKRFIDLHIFAFQDHQQNINAVVVVVDVCDEIVQIIISHIIIIIDNRHTVFTACNAIS